MPDPTYSTATIEGVERLICLIPDASVPDGHCGWYSAPLERGDAEEGMLQHLSQRHGAPMIAQDEAPAQAAEADEATGSAKTPPVVSEASPSPSRRAQRAAAAEETPASPPESPPGA